MKTKHTSLARCLGLMTALTALCAQADSSTSRFYFSNLGPDPDAKGRAEGSFTDTKSTFTVVVSKLDRSSAYDILVDGITQGTFTTDRGGSATVRFRAPATGSSRALDFDPRGKSVTVSRAGTSLLEGIFSGSGELGGSSLTESARLTNHTPGSRAKAKASYVLSSSGARTLSVSISDMTSGSLDVHLNGQPLGTLTVSRGAGALRLRSGTTTLPPGYLPLAVDPRGASIDILSGTDILFSGQLAAKAFGASVDRRRVVLLPIAPVAQPPVGTAKAKWAVSETARRHFSVEIEDAPLGAYDLLVNGVVRGVINVVTNSEGDDEGEIEFSNDDDGDELPLVFDPLGATITISQASVVLFESVFDPSSLSGIPSAEPPSRTDETLTSTGIDADAKAEGRYEVDSKGRHRFNIEIEDVEVGAYSIRVSGVHRATLQAVSTTGGVEGEVEFRSVVEPRKVLLNFDPRGQLIEIVNAAGETLFAHVFGSGSAGDDGTVGGVTPQLWTVALLAEDGVTGSTSVSFERKLNGDTKLKVKVRNVPVGNYDFSVGGTVRGSVNVVVSGGQTEGELEFENDPDDASELLLNFTVADQPAALSQGATVLFSRVLPE
ncbi:MAG: hypothetical protein JNJ83_24670 [Verrucomicrobiaceae bacterium]|nr:hypothetical protein [Verrucomicrobiaceae bacterium]